MTETSLNTPSPNRDRSQLIKEVTLVVVLSLIVTGGLSALQFSVAWIRDYVLALVAALFLYLPLELLYRQGVDPADFGISKRPILRSLKNALWVSLLVFPIYLVGFHYWQVNYLGNDRNQSMSRLDQWPLDIQDRPKVTQIDEGSVSLYAVGELIWMRWRLPPGQHFSATVNATGPIIPEVQRPVSSKENTAVYEGRSDGKLAFRTAGHSFNALIQTGQDTTPPNRIKLGAGLREADANPLEFERSFWWIINIILIQFLLVALPEEVFYRGYLQTRLDQIFTHNRRILGVELSVASLLITSTIFAVGHYVTIPSPHRLAVFFPSLLFGWMRRATGGILAPLIFHALCNLVVEFASLYYT
ncbi:MAG: myxosortase MrtP [Bradymonadia bacterium]